MIKTDAHLQDRILAFLRQPCQFPNRLQPSHSGATASSPVVNVESPRNVEAQSDTFDSLALDVFAFQYAHNAPYRAYCERFGYRPGSIAHWSEIPATPTSAFKYLPMASFPVANAVAEFHTSGTTRQLAGKHFFKTLDLYHAAILPVFRSHLLPDDARLPFLMLTPSPVDAPHSSLVHMLQVVANEFASSFKYYTEDYHGLVDDLAGFIARQQPVMLLGTAFGFVRLFDFMRSQQIRLVLPDGSRAMETGGYKGRSRVLSKPDLYAMFEPYLGLSSARVVNEYGMTELSTQFYDATLRVGYRTDIKPVPPWSRVMMVDARSGKPSMPGIPGLIRVLDLANLGSCLCIQTEDIGVAHPDGIEILGRATGAEPRGCSLAAA